MPELTTDEQAPPLLPVPRPRLRDSTVNLDISLLNVVIDLLSPLVDLSDCGFLLDHKGLHVLEELSQLDHFALNLGNVVVSSADCIAGRIGFSAATTLEKLLQSLVCAQIIGDFRHLQLAGRSARETDHRQLARPLLPWRWD